MDGWVGELVVGLSSLPTPSVVVFGKLMQVDGFGWGGGNTSLVVSKVNMWLLTTMSNQSKSF